MNLSELIGKYVDLRDRKKAIQERHKQELAPYNEGLDGIESAILNYFNEVGVNSAASDFGTAYRSMRESFTVEDPILFREWVQEQGDLAYFENRASKEAVKQHLEATGALPPGIKYNAESTIGVRRS